MGRRRRAEQLILARPLVVVSLAVAVVLATTPSRADFGESHDDAVGSDEEPSTQHATPTTRTRNWELGATASYVTPPIRGGTTPFGVGLGARVGFNVSHLHFGVDVVYFLGGTDVTLSDRALLFGGVVGYDVVLWELPAIHSTLVLRPLAGVGDAAISHSDPATTTTQTTPSTQPDVVTTASGRTVSVGGGSSGGTTSSDTTTIHNVYVRPALSLMLVTDWHYVALEGSMLVVPGIGYGGADPTTWISYGARIDLGVRF